MEPKVTDDYSLNWSKPDDEKVLRILYDEHQFSLERVKPILEKFSQDGYIKKQKTLF